MVSRRQFLVAAGGAALLGAGRPPKRRHPLALADHPRAVAAATSFEDFTENVTRNAGHPTAIRAASANT